MATYMGSKGYVTAPTTASAIYAVTDSTTARVWALTANNTKSTTAPTGNGLLVFGTTDEVGTVTLTTYMSGGVTANGSLQFDNASNAFTATINANPSATASYTLTLPAAQGAANTVLTNDGAGNLSWAAAGSPTLSNLTNGTGISAFTYNGSAAATVALANTTVTASNYGDANDFTTFTVNAQGQLTAAGTQPLPTTLPPSGAAGGDLTGMYPNPTLNEIQGIGVTASGANAPTNGQVLEYTGGFWTPTTLSSGGSVTSVTAGTGLTGGTITTSGTIGLAATSVTAASYGDVNDFTTFTVNAQGQLTAAGTEPLPTTLPPSGTAGGDLSGTYPNPTIGSIQGFGVTASGANAPATGQVLQYNGSNWIPTTPTLGTVTSVGLSVPGSSIFGVTGTPVTSTGTLGLTTTGNSGGIPYFSSGSVLSSSATLTQYGIVYGGGAGAAPAATAAGTSGQLLQSNGTSAPTWSTLTAAANSGVSITNSAGNITVGTNGVLNTIVTITGATTSYSPSAGTKAIQVELIGAGGGGGSTTSPGSNGSAGGGGGAGGYIKFYLTGVSSATTYTVAVGTGGAGGSSGSNGSAGNSTTFNTGSTTYTAGGGGGGLEGNANYGIPGGAGGTNSGGALISISGSPGGTSWDGNTSAAVSGAGGSSVLGGGGAAVNLTATGGPTTGNAGATNSGAGGSGGVTVGHAAATGGAGANGIIIITEYK
jgi:hypothetical protein